MSSDDTIRIVYERLYEYIDDHDLPLCQDRAVFKQALIRAMHLRFIDCTVDKWKHFLKNID